MNTTTPQSAFPYEEWVDSPSPEQRNPINHPGMSLRDYFAAKAMQAYISSYPQGSMPDGLTIDDIASDAWDMADAMLMVRTNA